MKLRFMAGLPRTGTTLLSAILSQNESVYLSPLSDLSEYLRLIHQFSGENKQLNVLQQEPQSLLKGAAYSFYADKTQSVIIDKSRRWGAPYYLSLLTEILNEPPLILSPIRPLSEVITSFIVKAQQNDGTNFIDQRMIAEDFLPYWRKPINDARVDWLLRPDGMIGAAMLSLASAYNPETSNSFHVFTYEQLVNQPSSTINGIYDFIGADRYDHDFSVIPAAEPHKDFEALGIPDLHTVRSSLSYASVNPETVLSDYALSRCEIEDFWTGRQ